MVTPSPSTPSPCTGVCTLDPARTHCLGCLRTLAEIARWGSASEDDRARIVASAEERRRNGRPG